MQGALKELFNGGIVTVVALELEEALLAFGAVEIGVGR
jgi:hypothetical protein